MPRALTAAVLATVAAVAVAVAVAVAGPASTSASASPPTARVLASADARVDQASRTSNFGTYKLAAGGSPVVRSYLKFTLTGLSGTVTSARLRIFPDTASTTGFQVRGTTGGSWSENELTWANAPAVGNAVSSSGPYRCCSAYVSADVSRLVTGNGTVTVALTTSGSTADEYRSREWGSSYAPQLVVTTASSTAADTTAPRTPTGLAATPGDGRVTLSWTASSDDVGVTGFRLYRDGLSVGTSPTTSYTATGLTNGTSSSWSVAAYDAVGNTSAQSAAITAIPRAGSSAGTPAATYYVSTTGSDAHAGSQAAPWRTIGAAASAAPAGSTVVIMRGAYAEDVRFTASGTTRSPTTFQANASDTVTVRSLTFAASHVDVQGLSVSGARGDCVTIAPALTDLAIRNSTIRSCGTNGIGFTRPKTQAYTSGVMIAGNAISGVGTSSSYGNDLTIYGDAVTVQDNDLTGTPNDALAVWGDGHVYRHNRIHDISNANGNHNDAFQTWTGLDDGAEGHALTNLLIERNTIENVTGPNSHCVMSEGPGHRTWTIRSNVLRNVGDQCLIFGNDANGSQGIQGLKIYNNTFVAAGANNTIEFNLTSSGVLANNIFYNCHGYTGSGPYHVASAASVTRDYDLSGGTSPKLTETHGKNADPAFVDAQAGDFHLAAASPAVNSGDNGALISPVRALDLDGLPASNTVDIGAYEYP